MEEEIEGLLFQKRKYAAYATNGWEEV